MKEDWPLAVGALEPAPKSNEIEFVEKVAATPDPPLLLPKAKELLAVGSEAVTEGWPNWNDPPAEPASPLPPFAKMLGA